MAATIRSDGIFDHDNSNRFIYMNDDFFMLRTVCPYDFITEKDELMIYLKEYPRHATQYGQLRKFDLKCPCSQALLR